MLAYNSESEAHMACQLQAGNSTRQAASSNRVMQSTVSTNTHATAMATNQTAVHILCAGYTQQLVAPAAQRYNIPTMQSYASAEACAQFCTELFCCCRSHIKLAADL